MATAKLFWSGRSQAVRLPKQYRFDAEKVSIRRQGNAIVLEPIANDWAWLDDITGPVDSDFVEAAFEEPASRSELP